VDSIIKSLLEDVEIDGLLCDVMHSLEFKPELKWQALSSEKICFK